MSDIALQFNNHVIIAQSMTGNILSGGIDLSNVLGYAVQAVWSGTPVGNIIIKGSNDGLNFTTVSTTAVGGAAGSLLVNNDGIHYNTLQVSYAFTSGTGTLDVTVSAKKYV